MKGKNKKLLFLLLTLVLFVGTVATVNGNVKSNNDVKIVSYLNAKIKQVSKLKPQVAYAETTKTDDGKVSTSTSSKKAKVVKDKSTSNKNAKEPASDAKDATEVITTKGTNNTEAITNKLAKVQYSTQKTPADMVKDDSIKTFKDVNKKSVHDLQAALNNPNFPFVDSTKHGKSTLENDNIWKHSKEYYGSKIYELTGKISDIPTKTAVLMGVKTGSPIARSNVAITPFATATLGVTKIMPPTSYPWYMYFYPAGKSYTFTENYMTMKKLGAKVAFCIQPGVNVGSVYTSNASKIPALNTKEVGSMMSAFGNLGGWVNDGNGKFRAVATQVVVWNSLDSSRKPSGLTITPLFRSSVVSWEYKVANEATRVKVVPKWDATSKKVVAGKKATFNVTNTPDGNLNMRVASVTGGGKATFSGKTLTVDTYGVAGGKTITVNLTKGPKQANETPQTWTSGSGQQLQTGNYWVPTSVKVYTEQTTGNLKIKKLGDGNKPLAGVEFKVTWGSTTKTVVTNANGEATVTGIPTGTKPVVKESKTLTSQGYVLDTTSHTAPAIGNGTTVTMQLTNKLMVGKLHVIKTGDAGKPLAGAVFTVTQNGVAKDYTTDANGFIDISGIKWGTKVDVKEKTAPTGYVLNSTPQTVTIKDTNTHNMTFTNALGKGNLKVIKTGDASKPLAGATFTVTIGSETKDYVTDAKGEINISDIKHGTAWKAVEKIAPKGYVLDATPQSGSIVMNQTSTATFKDAKGKGNLKVIKYGDDGKTPLANAVFTVTINGVDKTYTTDDKGEINVSDLKDGTTWSVKEIQAPEGYVLNTDNKANGVITMGKTDSVDFTNKLGKGSLKVVKKDDSNHPLAGATFTITLDGVTKDYVTDAKGEINIPDIKHGTKYKVKEIKAPEGYTLDSTESTGVIKMNEVAQVNAINKLKHGNLHIHKVDDSNQPLKGVVFTVTIDGVATDYTTDVNGDIKIDGIPYGESYSIKEKSGLAHYIMDDKTYSGTVKDTTITQNVVNKWNGMTVEVHKEGKTTGTKPYNGNNYSLAGAVFEIHEGSATGKVVATLTTDAKGIAKTGTLDAGKTYVAVETKAPKGYNKDAGNQTLSTADATTGNHILTFKDSEVLGKISISKILDANWQTGQKVDTLKPGIEFEVTSMSTMKSFGKKVTGTDGKVEWDNLPLDVYKVSETKPLPGYVQMDDEIVTLSQDVPNVDLKKTFVNHVKNYSMFGIEKIDSSSKKVIVNSEMTFKVKNLQNNTYLKDSTGNDVFTTTKGEWTYGEELMYGKYQIEEVTAPNGYKKLGSPQVFDLTADGVPMVGYKVQVGDERIKGKISITKTGTNVLNVTDGKAETNELPLANAKFGVYARKDIVTPDGVIINKAGEQVATLTTDAKGMATTDELDLGAYYIKELSAPTGYLLDAKEHDVVLKDDGSGNTLVKVNVDVKDGWQDAVLNINKVSERKTPIANAEFDVKVAEDLTSNGAKFKKDETIAHLVTDAKGNASLTTKLPTNIKLYAVETKAPKGYYVPNTKYPFTWTANGNVASVSVNIGTITNKDQLFNVKGVKYGEILDTVSTEDKLGYNITKFNRSKTPLANVKFNVVATADNKWADGVIANHKGDVVDSVTTGADGKYASKNLPLGSYELVETETPAGYRKLKAPIAFEGKYAGQSIDLTETKVDVNNELQNVNISGKKVSDDSKPLADVTFGLYNKDDISVNGKVLAPKDTLLDVVKTDSEGKWNFTLDLPEGNYYVKEIHTVDGYTLQKDATDLTYKHTNNDDTFNISVKDILNVAQRHVLKFTKLGEFLTQSTSEDTDFGKMYTFNYKEGKINGAEFDLYAKEQIETLDGTKHYDADAKIEHLVVGNNGEVKTETKLYQGKYYLVETKAPAGYTIMQDPIDFEIKYLGEDVVLGETDVVGQNKLQTYDVKVNKLDEQLDGFNNNEPKISTVKSNGKMFGLFTATKVGDVAKDSLVGLAETKDGVADFGAKKLPSAQYYVKELKSDDEHDLLQKHYPVEILPFNNDVNVDANVYEDFTSYSSLDANKDAGDSASKDDDVDSNDDANSSSSSEDSTSNGDDVDSNDDSADAKAFKDLVEDDVDADASDDANVDAEAVVEHVNEEGKPLVNKLHLGNLVVKKFNQNVNNQTAKGIESNYVDGDGVEFGLFDAKGNKIADKLTGKDGLAKFNNLPVGNYTVKELKAKNDHYRNDELVYVVKVTLKDVEVFDAKGKDLITSHKEDALVVNSNTYTSYELVKGKDYVVGKDLPVETYNVNSDFGKPAKLTVNGKDYLFNSGVEVKHFELKDGDTVKVEPLVTKVDDSILGQIANATQSVLDKITGVVPMSTVGALDEDVALEFVTNAKVDDVKTKVAPTTTNADVIYHNDVKQGDVVIDKTDATNGKEIPGAHLEILDKSKKPIISFVSKETSTKFHLEEGTYYLRETIAPKGYKLSTKVAKFEIKDGKATRIKFTNTPIKKVKKHVGILPKTGADLLGYGLVVLGLVLVIVAVIIYKKRKH